MHDLHLKELGPDFACISFIMTHRITTKSAAYIHHQELGIWNVL